MYGIVFWQCLLMGGEMGSETNIDLLLGSSTLSPTKFRLDRERRFCYELSAKKLVFFCLRQYLVEIESNYKHVIIFHTVFFPAHAVMCQGRCLQVSSPNSQWFTTYDLPIVSVFWLAQLVHGTKKQKKTHQSKKWENMALLKHNEKKKHIRRLVIEEGVVQV